MSELEITKRENSRSDTSDAINSAREKEAKKLNIDLSIPHQEGRIEALKKLYGRYVDEISVEGFIYKDISRDCDRLMVIYRDKQMKLDELKILDDNFSSIKVRLENIKYKYQSEISDLEKNISFNQKLLAAYKNRYLNNEGIDSVYRKKIKVLEDVCWENWLKALDVNKELQNTIIGFENRKALLEISKLYVDYSILVETEISKCFKKLKQIKRSGILEYYEILSQYDIPLDKKIDFKVFLQKKIEAKLANASEVKQIFSKFLTLQEERLDSWIEEVKVQYKRDHSEISTIINYYKKFLLNKQVLFTNETEQLVLYFKRRYVEKIDLLCSRFQMFASEASAHNRKLSANYLDFLKKMIDDEFQVYLNELKIKYSKKFLPFLDNYWHLEQSVGSENALNEEALHEKMSELKMSKNLGLKGMISEFEQERDNLKKVFDSKMSLLSEDDKFGVSDFDSYLKELRDECEVLCCELINLNARAWTKINAEFNCEARKYLIKLRSKYSAYMDSWRGGGKSWMRDYLIINLNQEFLKAVGEVLVGLTPEAALYLKASEALMSFNEKSRKILASRDSMEISKLMDLNRLPVSDIRHLSETSENKLKDLESMVNNFDTSYNSFYNSLLMDSEVNEI